VTLKIGFLVNPIAGIGGKKAWKGTDELDAAWDLFEEGEQYAFERVTKALSSIASSLPLLFYYCGNPMGEDLLKKLPFDSEKVYSPKESRTSASNTQTACEIFLEKGVDLIIFVGGDGTARDVTSIISDKIPVLGIPSGVKMFSGCFLYHPRDLGEILDEIVSGEIAYAPEDVLDVDEKLFRENRVQASLYGQLIVPQKVGLIQGGKISSAATSAETYDSIAYELVDEYGILDGLIVLGTGSTVYHILKSLKIEKTLLGVDLLKEGKIHEKDIDEETLYEKTKGKDIKIILTPIGGQGFLLGRGNQQISSRVLKSAKSFEFIIVSPEQKLATIDVLELDLDEPTSIPDIKNGFIKVLTGFHMYSLAKINVQVTD
jgi:predicted polyphosphate/ATP-dependent NAD kinase